MSTQDNLQAAFAGESQANRKYLAFAAKADAEGHPQIAKLFRAAAAAETVHAHAHLRVMEGVGDTKQNLQAAIEGEGHEFKEMYPAFIKEAEAEGNKAALISFRNANAVEKTHHDLYSKALEDAGGGEGPDACGHLRLRCLRPHGRGRGPRQVPGVRSTEDQVQGSVLKDSRLLVWLGSVPLRPVVHGSRSRSGTIHLRELPPSLRFPGLPRHLGVAGQNRSGGVAGVDLPGLRPECSRESDRQIAPSTATIAQGCLLGADCRWWPLAMVGCSSAVRPQPPVAYLTTLRRSAPVPAPAKLRIRGPA